MTSCWIIRAKFYIGRISSYKRLLNPIFFWYKSMKWAVISIEETLDWWGVINNRWSNCTEPCGSLLALQPEPPAAGAVGAAVAAPDAAATGFSQPNDSELKNQITSVDLNRTLTTKIGQNSSEIGHSSSNFSQKTQKYCIIFNKIGKKLPKIG